MPEVFQMRRKLRKMVPGIAVEAARVFLGAPLDAGVPNKNIQRDISQGRKNGHVNFNNLPDKPR